MPSNSSSRLNTMSGFQSVMARRSSDRLSLNPNGMTSCPAFFRCEITSYSVRHSSISFSVEPFRESGGTSVACTRTSARAFFTAPHSTRGSLRSSYDSASRAYHPQQFALQSRREPRTYRPNAFTALDHQAQHLMHQVFAECARSAGSAGAAECAFRAARWPPSARRGCAAPS